MYEKRRRKFDGASAAGRWLVVKRLVFETVVQYDRHLSKLAAQTVAGASSSYLDKDGQPLHSPLPYRKERRMTEVYVGIDVCKDRLDVAMRSGEKGDAFHVANSHATAST